MSCDNIHDGLIAHISEILFAQCAERNIQIVLIPPHSSHLVQPLDQGAFRSMKSKYSTVPNLILYNFVDSHIISF